MLFTRKEYQRVIMSSFIIDNKEKLYSVFTKKSSSVVDRK